MSVFVLNKPNYQFEKKLVIDEHNDRVVKNTEHHKKDENHYIYKKIKKIYNRLIKSPISIFSNDNTLSDLIIRDAEEFQLISTYRINKYNKSVKQTEKMFKKIAK